MGALPYATSALPGCGGAFKLIPEDFEVEEVPAYLPSGEGEHAFLRVEKRGLSTPAVVKLLSLHLGIDEREVGVAGLKDQQAVTRQWMSIPARLEAALATFSHPSARVLEVSRHRNKLRTGHLLANRFRIRLRKVRDPLALAATLDALVRRGVPNYFGEQRFGRQGDNAELGRKLLLGERLPRPLSRFERKLFLSAFQSALFNRALADRLRQGTWTTALLGDVLMRHDSGGAFVCEQPAVDQPRVDSFEISPAGPLFGPKLLAARGKVAEAEAAVLAESGVPPDAFTRGRGETQGARRPYRVLLAEAAHALDGEDAVVGFRLPPGSYATVVLRELLKGESGDGGGEEPSAS